MSPFDLTLALTIVVLSAYALNGFRNFSLSQGYESFFLANRQLSKANVRNTFSGATISIATVLVFFLTIGVAFGWWIIWSPATLALGVLVFNLVVFPRIQNYPGLARKIDDRSTKGASTLFGVIDHFYGSKILSTVVTSISGLGVVAILVAEMMVGVTIFERYFIRPEYIVFILSATLFLYTGLGGLRSVVDTDRWQVSLIIAALTFIVFALLLSLWNGDVPSTVGDKLLDWRPVQPMPTALLINILVVNLALLPSSLRVWQIVIATDRQANFRGALWQATAMVAFVSLAALFVSKFVTAATATPPTSVAAVFEFLTSGPSWIAYLLYPLFVCALLSALISTADSSILPLGQMFAAAKKEKFDVRRNMAVIFALIVLVIGTYFVVTSLFGMQLVPWILTVFAISTCVAPVVVGPLLVSSKQVTARGAGFVAGATLLACGAAFWWSVRNAGDLSMQPWNCLIGFSISALAVSIVLAVSPSRPSEVLPDTSAAIQT